MRRGAGVWNGIDGFLGKEALIKFMKYENRVPVEGINTDEATHPLKEFLILTGVIALGAGLIVVALGLSAQFFAKFIPFHVEQQLATRFEGRIKDAAISKEEVALNAVVNKILPGLQLPSGMTIKMHYLDEKTVNAFATLGGHVFVYRGLLESLPSENALAFVLAHEIAHVKHRHPAQALGRGVAIGLALAAISSGAGGSMADRPLGAAGLLTTLKFTRNHESEADTTALRAIVQAYGNAAGATEVFTVFEQIGQRHDGVPEVLLTHPLSVERGARLRELVKSQGWPLDGPRIAVPHDLLKSPKADPANS